MFTALSDHFLFSSSKSRSMPANAVSFLGAELTKQALASFL